MATPTDTGFVEMRLSKTVALSMAADEEPSFFVVLDDVARDRQLSIQIGSAEAFNLSAALTGVELVRPMSPHFAADLLRALGGRIRQVRIDRLITAFGGTALGATVEVEGPSGVQLIDARPSDALNLLAFMPATIFVAPEVLTNAEAEMDGSSPRADLLRHALQTEQTTVRQGPARASSGGSRCLDDAER
jgi:uncharacterized protein